MDPSIKTVTEGLSLADFLKIIKNRWALIAVIFLLVVFTAAIGTYFLPQWYRAVTGIRVEKPEGEVSVFERQISGNFDPYFIQEQFQIIQSKKILRQVIQNLNLVNELSRKLSAPLDEEQAFQYMLKSMLDVESRSGTSLIDIGVSVVEDPELAAKISNEIARVYAEDRIEFATSGQTEGINRLKEELKLQEQIVSRERDNVEKLREDLQIAGVDINSQVSQIDIDNLRQLERTYIALKVDSIARKTRWERFSAVPEEERFKLVNSELIPDPNIQNLMQAYMVAEQNYTALKGRFGEAHPNFISASESFKKIKEQLINQLDGYEQSLEISYIESQARVQALEEQLKAARVDQILDAQSKLRPFEEAVQRLRDAENVLKTFRLTLRQREIDFQVPKRTIEILNEAVPPQRPSKPNWYINMALAIIGGFALGVACAFMVEFVDTSFRSVEDLERKLQLPILGVISRNLVLIGRNNFDSFESEPYRVVQTNLELARSDKRGSVFTVQSAGPGEGKSTTLYNLAAVMALAGQKVLVIDSDLRRPSLHKIFGLPRKPGLIDCLVGTVKCSEVIQESKIPNLYFISSGQSTHFSLSLLHGKQLDALLGEVRGQYDKILLDSPPVIGISDASVLASKVDGVIFIVQHRRNPQAMTLRAKQIIENVEGQILGVVLNQVPDSGDEDYNYYTSNYYYYSHKTGSKRSSSGKDDDDVEALRFEEPEPEKLPKV